MKRTDEKEQDAEKDFCPGKMCFTIKSVRVQWEEFLLQLNYEASIACQCERAGKLDDGIPARVYVPRLIYNKSDKN